MKFIAMLLGLLLVGYLVSQQLSQSKPSIDQPTSIDGQALTPPRVPNAPEGVKAFEADINQFIHDSASDRNKTLD